MQVLNNANIFERNARSDLILISKNNILHNTYQPTFVGSGHQLITHFVPHLPVSINKLMSKKLSHVVSNRNGKWKTLYLHTASVPSLKHNFGMTFISSKSCFYTLGDDSTELSFLAPFLDLGRA